MIGADTQYPAPHTQPGTEAEVRSVIGALALGAARHPERLAYIDAHGALSYAALCQAARRGAAWLARQGVKPGDTVALALDATEEHARRDIGLLYAVAWLGAVVLPLFPEVPAATRAALLRRYRAGWLLAEDASAYPPGARVLDPRRFDPADAALDRAAVPRGDRPDTGFVYVFTSGTTGDAKAVLATHWQQYGRSQVVAAEVGMDGDDRLLTPIPWPSNAALRYLLRAHTVGAGCVSARIGSTRAALGAVLARFGVTRMFASPFQIRRLLQSPAPAQPLPPLRSLNIMGAVITPDEVEAARAALSPHLLVDYGSNESGPIAVLRAAAGNVAPGCVGRLVRGMESRVDGPQGEPLPAGAVGELGFRSASMCTAYADNPQATRERFRDGWFYPGDIGSIDAGGNIYLRGRIQDVVNYGGLKIWPEDVEAVLKQHPEVFDAALVGIPDPQAGQVPVAFVVQRVAVVGPPAAWLGEAALRAFCAARIDATRLPVRFFPAARIPRNESGKISREALVQEYLRAVAPRAAS